MGEVVELDVDTTLHIPPDKVLKGAIDWKLDTVIVIGWDEKRNLYFAGSSGEVGENLVLLELAKKSLLENVE